MTLNTRADGHMTVVEHLAELRIRLIKSVLALLVGGVACWILYPFILDMLLRPYCQTFPVEQRINSGLFGPTADAASSSPTRLSLSVCASLWLATGAGNLHADCVMAGVAVRGPRAVQAREALRTSIRGLRRGAVRLRRSSGLLEPATGAGLPRARRRHRFGVNLQPATLPRFL